MKKATAIILSCAAVILIAAIIVAVVWIKGLNTYKDIGVDYSGKDVDNAADKAGISLVVDGTQTGADGKKQSLSDYLSRLEDETKELGRDYDIVYSDYAETTFELTDAEATAMLNKLFPSLTFLTDLQVKVLEDGRVEVTSGCKVQETLEVMYPNNKIRVPSVFPKTVNLHAIGTLTVNNNIMTYKADQIDCVLLDIIPGNPGTTFTQDLSKVFTDTPELYIKSMKVNSDGNFVVTGIIPKTVTIDER